METKKVEKTTVKAEPVKKETKPAAKPVTAPKATTPVAVKVEKTKHWIRRDVDLLIDVVGVIKKGSGKALIATQNDLIYEHEAILFSDEATVQKQTKNFVTRIKKQILADIEAGTFGYYTRCGNFKLVEFVRPPVVEVKEAHNDIPADDMSIDIIQKITNAREFKKFYNSLKD